MATNLSGAENFTAQPPFAATMTALEVHEVRLPPPTTAVQKLRHRLSEIFFPDDPLHKFKDQTLLRKFVLGLQFFFPIFQWAPNYSLKLLKSDVVSGLTIASLAIPQVHSAENPNFLVFLFLFVFFGCLRFLILLI